LYEWGGWDGIEASCIGFQRTVCNHYLLSKSFAGCECILYLRIPKRSERLPDDMVSFIGVLIQPVDNQQGDTRPDNTRSNRTHDLGINDTRQTDTRTPDRTRVHTACVFHPLCTIAARRLYLLTVSARTLVSPGVSLLNAARGQQRAAGIKTRRRRHTEIVGNPYA